VFLAGEGDHWVLSGCINREAKAVKGLPVIYVLIKHINPCAARNECNV